VSPVAERHETYAADFEAFRRDPAFGAGTLAEARSSAFQRFLGHGFPTTREEEWRFTNVAPIAALTVERAAPAVPPAGDIAALRFDGVAAELVVVNGRLVPALSSATLPPGVTLRSLRDAFAADAAPAAAGATPFVDLNTAFFEDGVALEIAPGAIVTDPLHLLHVSVPGRASLVSPRVAVRVGERAQVAIVESYAGLGEGVAFTNAVTTIAVGAGAVVDHVKLQNEPAASFHLASQFVRIGRGGTIVSRALTFGGRIARNDIVAVLDGEGAECTLDGLYVASGESLVDTHTTIDHAQPHCRSHEMYKGILTGRVRAVFNGKIIVRPQAQKTDAKQTNRALLLTDDAQVNTKPQLEIFADDVKCTHGAAVGQLDDDAMFYLRARGIPAAEARNLLVHAFAGEVLDGVRAGAVRDRAMRLTDAKLAIELS
jgi:Fe-S cluster assembly protein SufD